MIMGISDTFLVIIMLICGLCLLLLLLLFSFRFRCKNLVNLEQTNALCRNVLVSVALSKRIRICMRSSRHSLFVSFSLPLGRHLHGFSYEFLALVACPWVGRRS